MMGPDIHSGFDSSPLPEEETMERLALNGGDPLLHPLSLLPDSPPSSSRASPTHLLDPPSYADAVFAPYDPLANGDGDGGDGDGGDATPLSPRRRDPSSFRSRRSAASEYSAIVVSDPQKELETNSSLVPGSGTYVTYLIATRTRDGEEFRVRRRFRDVVALDDRLAEAYRGFFVPPRPDKSIVEGQLMYKHEFVEQRRSALEKYLQRLAAHPVIGQSDELRAFLMATGRLPFSASTDVASRRLDGAARRPFREGGGYSSLAPQDMVRPAKGGRDLMRIFRELKQSVASEWVGTKPMLVEEDKEFLDRKGKVQDLEQQLTIASQQAESLVKAQQDIGEAMGDMGLTFIKLAKFETEQATLQSQRARAAEIKSFATAAVKASRLYRELNAQTVKHLDTLHEYLGLLLAVHTAFSDRSSALLTVQTLMSDLSSLHAKEEKLDAASSKLFGVDKSKISKIEELKETIRITEDAQNCATREYERIKENNRNELDRLDKERHEDFIAMLKGFVVNQVGYTEKIASVWTSVAEETWCYAREQLNYI